MSSTRRILIIQSSVWAFLAAAWLSLSAWYYDWQFVKCLGFIFFLALAIGLSVYHHLPSPLFKKTRLIAVAVLLFIMLPWGEWLRLNFLNSREEWSRQLVLSAVFFHVVLSANKYFSNFFSKVFSASRRFLQRRTYSIWFPPLFFFLLAAYVANGVYHKTSMVPDSASYLFEAKILAAGKITAPAPRVPEFFNSPADLLFIKDGKWFSVFTPGLPALLVPALKLGLESYLLPLFGSLTILVWILYALRWHGKVTAFLLGYLMALSPAFLILSATVLTHVVEVFACSLAVYISRKDLEANSLWNKAALFLVISAGILVRPFSVLVFLTPLLLYCSIRQILRRQFSYVLSAVLAVIIGVALIGFYFDKTTGNPWTSPTLLELPQLKWGFGENQGGIIHTPVRGLENMSNHLLAMNFWLSGWYPGSLVFVILFLIFAPPLQLWDRILICSSLAVVGFYYFWTGQEILLGPRYYLLLAPYVLLLVARSTGLSGEISGSPAILATTLFLAALISATPLRLISYVQRCNATRDLSGVLKDKIEQLHNPHSLVFLSEETRSEFVGLNDPFLRTPFICLDLRERNGEVLQAYPGYKPFYFRLITKSVKGHFSGDYRIVPDRETASRGHVSLFYLALAIQASEPPSMDLFDRCYATLFTPGLGADEWNYLSSIKTNSESQPQYRTNFEEGLIHSARMLILPKIAVEREGKAWPTVLDIKQFRSEYEQSLQRFRSSGPIGDPLLMQYDKIAARIDQNQDRILSDDEIRKFLAEKIMILQYRMNF